MHSSPEEIKRARSLDGECARELLLLFFFFNDRKKTFLFLLIVALNGAVHSLWNSLDAGQLYYIWSYFIMLSLHAGPARLNTTAINADGFYIKDIVRQYESFKVEYILTFP